MAPPTAFKEKKSRHVREEVQVYDVMKHVIDQSAGDPIELSDTESARATPKKKKKSKSSGSKSKKKHKHLTKEETPPASFQSENVSAATKNSHSEPNPPPSVYQPSLHTHSLEK